MKQKLPRDFFNRSTLKVAREILGCELITHVGGQVTSGLIVEVEAYCGKDDPACHSAVGRTKRNEVMFWDGGHCYVYLIYGVHHCVNIVTEGEGIGAAVLIRAVEPTSGIETMRRRRLVRRDTELTSGPGKLCQAMGIDRSLNAEHFLSSAKIELRRSRKVPSSSIARGTRIGISKGKEQQWRFFIKNNPYVSSAR